ncbi:hypothetical protein ACFL41_01490, partial [Gemmatimonadota bacterium]
ACVLETIRKLDCDSVEQLADYFHDFLPERFRKSVPDLKAFLELQLTEMKQTQKEAFDLLSKGVGIRWTDYRYPVEFHEKFDRNLWECFYQGKEHRIPYEEEYFTDAHGFFNHHPKGSVCPGMHYFPPQREQLDNLVLCTNHAIVPYIRLCEMDKRTALLAGRHINDIQWRYDALNDLILKKIENLAPGESLDEEAVKELIDFLAPLPDDGTRQYQCYYDSSQRSSDSREIAIEGSTSVMELKEQTMTSHFGYFCDEWVKLSLKRYI